jgi:hypothetical protein
MEQEDRKKAKVSRGAQAHQEPDGAVAFVGEATRPPKSMVFFGGRR